jgi:hypothetical protein
VSITSDVGVQNRPELDSVYLGSTTGVSGDVEGEHVTLGSEEESLIVSSQNDITTLDK